MNIGQFRRHLENFSDDGIVVFQPHNRNAPLAYPAMAMVFTTKQICLSDGKKSALGIVELCRDHRDCQWLTIREPESLYKTDGFYVNM